MEPYPNREKKMVKIKVTDDTNMKFFNLDTRKLQWYSTDMCKGDVMEFRDIAFADSKNVYFVCLDDELASLPVKSFLVSFYLPLVV